MPHNSFPMHPETSPQQIDANAHYRHEQPVWSPPIPHGSQPQTGAQLYQGQPTLAAALDGHGARPSPYMPQPPPSAYAVHNAVPPPGAAQAYYAAQPAYPPALRATFAADQLTGQLEVLRRDINAHLSAHPVRNNAGRLVTIVGSMGAIGAGIAMGVAVFGGAFAGITGIGIPVAAAAALSGVGVGLAGIGLAAMAGAATRAIARRNVAKDPALRGRILVLQQIQGELLAKKKLSPSEKAVLRNVDTVLGKVGGAKAHIKSQLKVAGKTSLLTTLSVGVLAILALAADGAGNSGGFIWFGSSPLPLPSGGGTAGRPLENVGEHDGAQMEGWSQQLRGLGPSA